MDGLLAKLGNKTVPLNCSSLFATSLPVLSRTGFSPAATHFDSMSEEFRDKVSVMNRLLHVDSQTRFPVSQTNSMYQIAGFGHGST